MGLGRFTSRALGQKGLGPLSSGSKDHVGTLIVESPERQVLRALIVRFLEHQQRNVNLQKRDGPATAGRLALR